MFLSSFKDSFQQATSKKSIRLFTQRVSSPPPFENSIKQICELHESTLSFRNIYISPSLFRFERETEREKERG